MILVKHGIIPPKEWVQKTDLQKFNRETVAMILAYADLTIP